MHPTRVHAQSGTEKWVRWAQGIAREMFEQLRSWGVARLQRTYRPDSSTLVWIHVTRWATTIMLSGGLSSTRFWKSYSASTEPGVDTEVFQLADGETVPIEAVSGTVSYPGFSVDGLSYATASGTSVFVRRGGIELELTNCKPYEDDSRVPDYLFPVTGAAGASFNEDGTIAVVIPTTPSESCIAVAALWDGAAWSRVNIPVPPGCLLTAGSKVPVDWSNLGAPPDAHTPDPWAPFGTFPTSVTLEYNTVDSSTGRQLPAGRDLACGFVDIRTVDLDATYGVRVVSTFAPIVPRVQSGKVYVRAHYWSVPVVSAGPDSTFNKYLEMSVQQKVFSFDVATGVWAEALVIEDEHVVWGTPWGDASAGSPGVALRPDVNMSTYARRWPRPRGYEFVVDADRVTTVWHDNQVPGASLYSAGDTGPLIAYNRASTDLYFDSTKVLDGVSGPTILHSYTDRVLALDTASTLHWVYDTGESTTLATAWAVFCSKDLQWLFTAPSGTSPHGGAPTVYHRGASKGLLSAIYPTANPRTFVWPSWSASGDILLAKEVSTSVTLAPASGGTPLSVTVWGGTLLIDFLGTPTESSVSYPEGVDADGRYWVLIDGVVYDEGLVEDSPGFISWTPEGDPYVLEGFAEGSSGDLPVVHSVPRTYERAKITIDDSGVVSVGSVVALPCTVTSNDVVYAVERAVPTDFVVR